MSDVCRTKGAWVHIYTETCADGIGNGYTIYILNDRSDVLGPFQARAVDKGIRTQGFSPPHIPQKGSLTTSFSAVRAGFEPAVHLRVRQFSKLVVSATHPSHLKQSITGIGLQRYNKFDD